MKMRRFLRWMEDLWLDALAWAIASYGAVFVIWDLIRAAGKPNRKEPK